MSAVKALQQWCKIQCGGYRDVSITNMTTSFRDGLAFCALIHKHRPELINFDSLSKENIYENNKRAFEVAENELGIPALLDAEDMVALKVPDRLSILTYVSQYYNYFHGRSPIGGMAGIKRPAEESNEAPSEKKNQPVTAKVFASPKPATENKTPKPVNENKREVLAERANKSSGSLSSSCTVCNQHVHLVQRHLVDGKLYHRNCFKCRECSTILLSGTYKPGKEPGTFICKTHTSTEKPLTAPTTHITVPPPKTQSTFITKTVQNASGGGTGKSGLTPNASKPDWLANKSDRTPTRGLVVTPTPAVQLKPVPKPTPTPETTTVKTSFNPKTPSEPLKAVSNSVQTNQEARKRFFEPSSTVPESKSTPSYTSTTPVSTVSVTPTTVSTVSVTPTTESTTPRVTAGAGAGKKRVLLRVGDWAKTQDTEKEKENEKEKAKVVIGKMVTVGKNNNSLSPSPAGLKASSSNVSPVESGAKGPFGRVRLKALDTDVKPAAPAATAPSWIKDNKTLSRPVSTLASESKDNDTAPSGWRSMLKPVKTPPSNIESTGSPSKRPEVAAASPRTSGLGITTASIPAPSTTSISISISSPKGPSPSPMNNSPKASDSSSGSSVSPVNPSGTETHKSHKPGYIPKEDIQKELKEIEMNMNELQKRGVDLEKQLRQSDEEGEEDTVMNDLMVDWFTLIRNKQVYMRRESELVYIAKTQDLEEEQPSVEAELRRLMDTPEKLKTYHERKREEELMAKLVEIVNDRNAILEGLDEDRLREEEEDEELNKMMQNLGTDVKKEKVKRKSSISRWFSIKK
ncbi:protein-methionine sulfoxide oxidase mical2b isoform X2 [Rhinichthys klamathensis goyatoka]|uniref:protein-methionine sulfoxide oxidase mical2b isoform X2 n=1 Tax=Rhinichthys klamathensis goyatoka TaxID=3034132 RepID=UPI0024B530F3|nr:protein-methionine sulfoxide oxidase mical2b isoform X2 [Rhinichthys klamathensis goyatoka]